MQAKWIIAAGCPVELAERWVQPLADACRVYSIDNDLRVTAFLAQVGHESDSFRRTVENLNYSAVALRKVFGKYFATDELAGEYARQPEKIANRVYANRMDNGPEESGDGWKYRGRGLIQLTGKRNVRKFSLHYYSSERLVEDPSPLEHPVLAAMSAGWYWLENGLNQLADKGEFEAITRKINGGLHGLEDRRARLQTIQMVMI